MTHRERWLNTLHFKPVDHVPDEEFGYWDETFTTWHPQGLPLEINNNGIADRYFRFAPRVFVPVSSGLKPGFETRIVEETEKYQILQGGDGAVQQVFTDGTNTIPRYLRFAIETREDWESFKERLDPYDPERYPADWDEHVKRLNQADVPVVVDCGSLFGRLRNYIGFENISIMCMDHPDLIEEMVEHWTWFITTLLERAVADVRIDAGAFWEDICFNKGPIVRLDFFESVVVPRYKRINQKLKAHGIDIWYTDCDGDVRPLLPTFLESGINCLFPFEVNGCAHPSELLEEYGRDLRIMGGVDKMELKRGPEAITAYLKTLVPLVERGGYIPFCDHRCPPDVSPENYLFYLDLKEKMFGMG